MLVKINGQEESFETKQDLESRLKELNPLILKTVKIPNKYSIKGLGSELKLLETIRVAVIGSRTYDNYQEFSAIMTKYIKKKENTIVEFVSGGAKGADSLIERYAEENGYRIYVFPADWSKGKSAGFQRNVTIWNNADEGIAFWDGKSKGTEHSFKLSKKQNKNLYVFNYIEKKWVTI